MNQEKGKGKKKLYSYFHTLTIPSTVWCLCIQTLYTNQKRLLLSEAISFSTTTNTIDAELFYSFEFYSSIWSDEQVWLSNNILWFLQRLLKLGIIFAFAKFFEFHWKYDLFFDAINEMFKEEKSERSIFFLQIFAFLHFII